MKVFYNINDIYIYNRDNNKPMLSNFTSGQSVDFWKPYKDNYTYFDRLFRRMYKSWFPMDQEGPIDEVSDEFAADVKSWLMINDKRYSELYRIQTIPDDDKYSLTDNVYETERINKSGEHESTFNKGAQTISDSGSHAYAAHTDTQDNERSYGSQTIEIDETSTQGSTGKTTTNSVSAFNDSGFQNADKSEEDIDSRTDTIDKSEVHGSHTDTEDLSTTYGAHTDTDSNTRQEGSRQDSETGEDSETISRQRSGNIGVKTVSQMLDDQKNTWINFSFYEIIFSEITRELLRGYV